MREREFLLADSQPRRPRDRRRRTRKGGKGGKLVSRTFEDVSVGFPERSRAFSPIGLGSRVENSVNIGSRFFLLFVSFVAGIGRGTNDSFALPY